MENKKYKLYVNKNISKATKEKFSFVPKSLQYAIVYSDLELKKEDGYCEVLDESIIAKDKSAMFWLTSCKFQVNVEGMKKNEEDKIRLLNAFADKVEKELQKELANQVN